jgi:hypothetical protein
MIWSLWMLENQLFIACESSVRVAIFSHQLTVILSIGFGL